MPPRWRTPSPEFAARLAPHSGHRRSCWEDGEVEHDAAVRQAAESGAPAPPDPSVHRRIRLGRSVLGRQIVAFELGDRDASRPLLVVGCIHGDEQAGIGVTRRLERGPPPRESQLWVVNDLNPDGVAADTRQNANLVDLNRNFPWRWRPLGKPGDQQYSGTRQLSEPESRIAASLILRLRPRITIWFHQPLGVIDESGGRPGVEHRFSALTGLPLRRLIRYPGSAAGWQNHRLPSSTAFVTELPAGRLPREPSTAPEGGPRPRAKRYLVPDQPRPRVRRADAAGAPPARRAALSAPPPPISSPSSGPRSVARARSLPLGPGRAGGASRGAGPPLRLTARAPP